MDIISRRIGKRFGQFKVYSQEEAEAEGIPATPWRECPAGSYGLSDDGFVALCLKRTEYSDRSKKRMRELFTYPYARVWGGPNSKLEYLPRKESKNYYSTGEPRTWADLEVRKSRTKLVVAMYAQMVLQKKIEWAKLAQAYRPNAKHPMKCVKQLMKNEKVGRMVASEIAKLLEEKGITPASVIDYYLTAKTVAERKDDAKSIVLVADRLARLVGLIGSSAQQAPPADNDAQLNEYSQKLLEYDKTQPSQENTQDAVFEQVSDQSAE